MRMPVTDIQIKFIYNDLTLDRYILLSGDR